MRASLGVFFLSILFLCSLNLGFTHDAEANTNYDNRFLNSSATKLKTRHSKIELQSNVLWTFGATSVIDDGLTYRITCTYDNGQRQSSGTLKFGVTTALLGRQFGDMVCSVYLGSTSVSSIPFTLTAHNGCLVYLAYTLDLQFKRLIVTKIDTNLYAFYVYINTAYDPAYNNTETCLNGAGNCVPAPNKYFSYSVVSTTVIDMSTVTLSVRYTLNSVLNTDLISFSQIIVPLGSVFFVLWINDTNHINVLTNNSIQYDTPPNTSPSSDITSSPAILAGIIIASVLCCLITAVICCIARMAYKDHYYQQRDTPPMIPGTEPSFRTMSQTQDVKERMHETQLSTKSIDDFAYAYYMKEVMIGNKEEAVLSARGVSHAGGVGSGPGGVLSAKDGSNSLMSSLNYSAMGSNPINRSRSNTGNKRSFYPGSIYAHSNTSEYISPRGAILSNDRSIGCHPTSPIVVIGWDEIHLMHNITFEASIIGEGSFGKVIKACWFPANENQQYYGTQAITVAVKVMAKSTNMNSVMNTNTKEKIILEAMEEMWAIKTAEDKIIYKDCIVKVYGYTRGKISKELSLALNISEESEAIGIILRYEGGGSLNELIHQRSDKSRHPLPMSEKLRLLTGIARGLAELHTAGIVHADIKPGNILLSSDKPPEVRLADFGLSIMRNEASMNLSTLAETSTFRGTPIYCAPEMLHNPYSIRVETNEGFDDDSIAKASRKTDMYAFAILAWELLAEQKPFTKARNETVLSSMIHQGERPPLDQIPSECPIKIKQMITSCWDSDRTVRKSAIECFSILQHQYDILSKTVYDIFISHDTDTMPLLSHNIFHRLTQLGYRIYYDQHSAVSPTPRDQRSTTMSMTSSSQHHHPSMYTYPNSQATAYNHPFTNNNTSTIIAPIPALQLPHGDSSSSNNGGENTTVKSSSSLPVAVAGSNTTLDNTKDSLHPEFDVSPRMLVRPQESERSMSTIMSNNYSVQAVSKCEVFVVILHSNYQKNEYCMSQLRAAKNMKPPRPIIPIFTQSDHISWANQEVVYLCQLRSSYIHSLDISDISMKIDWKNDDSISRDIITELHIKIDELKPYLPTISSNNHES